MSVGEEELSVRLVLVFWTVIITRYPSMIPFCWSSSSGSQVICIVLESTATTATLPGNPLGTERCGDIAVHNSFCGKMGHTSLVLEDR